MKKAIDYFKDHFIIILGSNIVGFIALIFSLFVLKNSNENTFNTYSAFASFYLIFSVPGKTLKNLSTLYGNALFEKIKNSRTPLIIIGTLLTGISIFVVMVYSHTDLISSLFLILAVITQIIILLFIGLIQHQKDFLNSSLYLLFQNILKFLFAVGLFFIIGNTGIWIAYFIATIISISFILKKKKFNSSQDIRIENSDLIINFLLLFVFEIIFSSDSILAKNNLSESDAHVYNSIILIKKAIFFSTLGVSSIILAYGKSITRKSIKHLFINLGLILFTGASFVAFTFIFKKEVLNFLEVDESYINTTLLLGVGATTFSILQSLFSWVTSKLNILKRIFLIILMFCFIWFYFMNFNDIFSGVMNFTLGTIVLIFITLITLILNKNNHKEEGNNNWNQKI